MDTSKAYILKKAYERYQKIGDKLAKIEPLIDWEALGRMVSGWVVHGWSGVVGESRALLCMVQ